MGGYFGARLQQAGHSVAYMARGRHLQALQRKGLALKSPLGDAQLKVKAVEKPADAGAVDVVVFAVKLWDTESQPMVTHRPSRHICFSLFGRTVAPHPVGIAGRPARREAYHIW